MKHLLVAVAIGVLTIGFSILVLSDSDDTYETDAKDDRNIVLNEAFEADNYTIKPLSFECDTFTSQADEEDVEGCILSIELTNTTIFEQQLNLDGDFAVAEDGTEFESSDDLSTSLIPSNGLKSDIAVDETVEGGIFFEIPANTSIKYVNIYESVTADPIVVNL